MAKRLLWVGVVPACSALAVIGILNYLEYALLYHPHPYRANYRQLVSNGVVELPFQTSAGRQMAFYIPPRNGSELPRQVWVLFCGNGSLALDWLPLTERNQSPGIAFLLIDYPGYGKSEGWPSKAGTPAAADGALHALAARLGTDSKTLESRLDVLGHSLGAAAALDFASSHRQVRRIILLAPFTSLRAEAAIIVGKPLSNLLLTNYDNRAALRQLAQHAPLPRVVIFHGLQDGMIPAAMGRELAAEFPAITAFRPMPEANHDTVVAAAEDEILGLIAESAR